MAKNKEIAKVEKEAKRLQVKLARLKEQEENEEDAKARIHRRLQGTIGQASEI